MEKYIRCFVKINLEAIRHNIKEVKKRVADGTKVMAVVKADGYGHGAVRVAQALSDLADCYATATLPEAVELRENGVEHPILVLGYVSPREHETMVQYDIAQSVYRLEDAMMLSETAGRLGKKGRVHIAVDTGMTRIGFQVEETEADRIAQIASMENISIDGIFTHLSCADQYDQNFTRGQMAQFDRMISMLKERGVEIPLKHLGNSAGLMELDEAQYDMVRSGIVTYGLYPSEEVHKEQLDLKPALEWKAHVIHVKDVPAGRGVSYGATYVTERNMRIATVSVGYADGYPRALSSKGCVLIHGQRAPILGRVCMDQMMVDVSHIPEVKVEDVATLIGCDGEDEITAEELSNLAGSFNYEQICRIDGKRVPRIYE